MSNKNFRSDDESDKNSKKSSSSSKSSPENCDKNDKDKKNKKSYKRRGHRGPRGERGEKGEPGPMGYQGPQGPCGPRGKRGKDGEPGCEGPQGCEGPRGYMGEHGHHGHTGYTGSTGYTGYTGYTGPIGATGPGFSTVTAFISNSSVQTIAPGGIVQFDTISNLSSGIDISNSSLTLQQGGKYFIDFYVRGSSDPANALKFGIKINNSVQLASTIFTSADNTGGSLTVFGQSLISFPDLSHAISTGAGSIIELQNMTPSNVILKDGSLNASLRILKIQ